MYVKLNNKFYKKKVKDVEDFISYCNSLNLGNENNFKDNVLKAVSNFENLSIEERNKFNTDKLKEIKNKQLRAELFCFVKDSNPMKVQTEKSALAKELLDLKKNENVSNEKCKEIINPVSRVMLYYYASSSKKSDDACQLVSAKDFYSIEFIKILFNNENEFIKKDLKRKLLKELSPNSDGVFENLNKPTVNIFENIRKRNSPENNLSAWLAWAYANFNYYDQTTRNFALIPKELRWQTLSSLLEINQNKPDNVNITIDHINLLSERDRKNAIENKIVQNKLKNSRKNNGIGIGFGIVSMIGSIVGLVCIGLFVAVNPFAWLGGICALIIGAVVTGVTSYNHRKINSVLNPPKPKSQVKEPLLNNQEVNIDKSYVKERTSVIKKVEQAKEETQNQQEEKPNNLKGQGNDEPNFPA